MAKTLIGKNDVLFLQNDSCEELKVHCNNLLKVIDVSLSRYNFNNFIMFVYPNKSFIFKDYLPDTYLAKYRPAFEHYKKILQDKVVDLYQLLKDENDVYYKTDTHINIKGGYLVYKYFISIINERLHINIEPKQLELTVSSCKLNTLPYGIGDLTWTSNVGDQVLNNITDNFYFHEDIVCFYCIYKITNESNIRFLNKELNDQTKNLEGSLVDWNIISEYIINVKHDNKISLKIVIFYDSFLLHSLALYFNLFNDVYFIKDTYSADKINLIKPDYVFEFRVERFLS